jgi:hypothetical protein
MTDKKIYMPGEKRQLPPTIEDEYLPKAITRDQLGGIFEDFVEDHLYDTKQFLKHFGDKRAALEIQVPSLLDLVKASVCYDSEDRFDVRLLVAFVGPIDRKLLIDVIKQASERFVNNPKTPKSPLTLMQFKVLLAYRMAQLGF